MTYLASAIGSSGLVALVAFMLVHGPPLSTLNRAIGWWLAAFYGTLAVACLIDYARRPYQTPAQEPPTQETP